MTQTNRQRMAGWSWNQGAVYVNETGVTKQRQTGAVYVDETSTSSNVTPSSSTLPMMGVG